MLDSMLECPFRDFAVAFRCRLWKSLLGSRENNIINIYFVIYIILGIPISFHDCMYFMCNLHFHVMTIVCLCCENVIQWFYFKKRKKKRKCIKICVVDWGSSDGFLLQQFWRQLPEKHRAVWQAVAAVSWPRSLHQGRDRQQRDLLLVFLRPRHQDLRSLLHLYRLRHWQETHQGGCKWINDVNLV